MYKLLIAILAIFFSTFICYRATYAESDTHNGTNQPPTVDDRTVLQPSLTQSSSNFQGDSSKTKESIERINILEEKLSAHSDSISDSRSDIRMLIATQFAIIIAFVGLAWWIEQKSKKSLEKIEIEASRVKQELNDYFNSEFNSLLGRIETACQSLAKNKGYQDLVFAGKVLYMTGKYKEASEIFDQAIDLDKVDPETRKFRGLSLRKLGFSRLEDSIHDLNYAIEADIFKNDSTSHFELAQAYLAAREHDKAIKHFELANINGYPAKEELNILLGDCYRFSNNLGKAFEIFSDILKKNPRSTPAVLKIGSILSNRNDYDQLINLYNEAISHQSNVSKYYVFLGVAYADRNKNSDFDTAIDCFNKAKECSENDWDIWYYEGRSYLHKWQSLAEDEKKHSDFIDKAISCFSHGEKLSKKSGKPRFVNQLSRLYLLTGKLDEAILEAERSVDLNPKHIQNHLTLITALLAKKKWPDSLEAIDHGFCYSVFEPSYIWCLFFKVIVKLLQKYEIKQIKDDLIDLINRFKGAKYFDASVWDWDVTEKIISEEIERLPNQEKMFIHDLKQVLNAPANILAFQNKWEQTITNG